MNKAIIKFEDEDEMEQEGIDDGSVDEFKNRVNDIYRKVARRVGIDDIVSKNERRCLAIIN